LLSFTSGTSDGLSHRAEIGRQLVSDRELLSVPVEPEPEGLTDSGLSLTRLLPYL
jgi:hypothetical protein